MLTQEGKMEMLGLCRDIGLKLTTLEALSFVEGVAKPQTQKLRSALEIVRHAIALSPVRESQPTPGR